MEHQGRSDKLKGMGNQMCIFNSIPTHADTHSCRRAMSMRNEERYFFWNQTIVTEKQKYESKPTHRNSLPELKKIKRIKKSALKNFRSSFVHCCPTRWQKNHRIMCLQYLPHLSISVMLLGASEVQGQVLQLTVG